MSEQLETKHIIKIRMSVYGRVDQSDIIGAIFGQTEDVLGKALDLRELQRKNKVGRIEVEIHTQPDKVVAIVTIPSGLDRVESVIIASALETIKKIGPCKAQARVESIEDIKRIKMREIIEKAKQVLQKFMSISVDSQELVDKVVEEVRKSQTQEYGEDKLIGGPNVEKQDEIIMVETKQELLNLLSQGIKNCIAAEDKTESKTLKELAETKVITALINRGKEFWLKKILENCEIDYLTKPEFGTRVVDMQSKEIYKAVRSRVSTKQILSNDQRIPKSPASQGQRPQYQQRPQQYQQRPAQRPVQPQRPAQQPQRQQMSLPAEEEKLFKDKFNDLKDSKDAIIIDRNKEVLGQVPVADLASTMKGIGSKIFAIVIHDKIPKDIVMKAERHKVRYLVGTETEKPSSTVRFVKL
ncbi:hypothetical protein KY311_03770 [Candidatus Woesearchaeota archaeon]|nr:hypothetical protein [Candidatus Woesearchaeota archaeon]MBW3017044.1 hypothetical protein [Candidatus Woesearchaeota archaeon]